MPTVSEAISKARKDAEFHFDRAERLAIESTRYDEALVHAVLAVAARLAQLTTVISIRD